LRETSASLARFITFYTLVLTSIYTFLAYKTPWCMVGFLWGMILLAGIGANALAQIFRVKTSAVLLSFAMLAASAQLSWQSWRASFGMDATGAYYCVSQRNPYVYSQTTSDLLKLVDEVQAIARVSPQALQTQVEVISAESYWPLPWYLRQFKQVGFWDHVPSQPPAPIMIVSTALHAAFDEGPNKTHLMAGYFQLRPGVFVELYVAINLWTDYIKTLPKERDD
jgi:predicted membrane-bound mannosyltransferase